MSIYSIPTLLGAISVFLIGSFVFTRNSRSRINQSFASLCFFLFVWLISYTITYSTRDKMVAYVVTRIACTSVMFTTSAIYLFVALYLKKFEEEKYWIYGSFGLMILLFPFFIFTKSFLDDPHLYPWGYYSKAGPLHPLYLIPFFGIWVKGLFMFFDRKLWSLSSGFEKNRIKYVLAMYFLATLGSIDYIQKYGIDFYPFGWMFELLFALVIAYAIVKYRLMDLSVAFTRTGIFVFVYSLVLGSPFALAFGLQNQLMNFLGEIWWIVPLICSTVLATAGPYIYIYIQKRAEDRLLREQRAYQNTLRNASLGMGQIKDLKRLLNLIVHIVTRAVRIEHCSIFLFHEASKQFTLKAVKGRKFGDESVVTLKDDATLPTYLKITKDAIVFEEILQRTRDVQDKVQIEIRDLMKDLDAALIVPSFIEQRLIAIIVLGKKRSGKLYSQDDLAVFSILANQSALAIENAQFYEDMKKTHEQLFKAEKMATIGTMADGLSHQINNRLHAMAFIASDTLDTIRLKNKDNLSPDMIQLLSEVETGLVKIQDNVKRGGEIVGGLLKYTRKGDQGRAAVDINKLLDSAIEMAQFKIKISAISIERHFNGALPSIYGNFTQLQEVFFNIIDNAYDAMMQRKDELKEQGYRPTLQVEAHREGKKMGIRFKDNGIGVKKDDMDKIFTPFFTTKLSSNKGTGLGMYVIRKLVEENHEGSVIFKSEYMIGSQTELVLPIVESVN